MPQSFKSESFYTMLVIILVVLALGTSLSLFFSSLMNDFLFEQKIQPQIDHTRADASLDVPFGAFERWEGPKNAETFERIYIDAVSQADIPRMDFFNRKNVLIWSSSGKDIGNTIEDELLDKSLSGEYSYRRAGESLKKELYTENLLEIYVPVALTSETGGHDEELPHRETEATGEVQGVIKLYFDDSELVELERKLNLYIFGLTFGSIFLIASVLYFVFRRQNGVLMAANKKISKMLGVKTEFMNQAAHDLRTPLTPILALLPIVDKQAKGKKNKQNISIIANNARYLSQIVENLVAFIKSDATEHNYNFQETKVKELVEEALANNKIIFQKKRIRVINNIGHLPPVPADRQKLTEVFQNIISNSIKFTDKDGAFTINSSIRNGFICLEFQDSGIGMDKEQLSRLFDAFYKADESRHERGSGLGLAICKRIMEGHHGKIMVESAGIGKGTTLTLSIPIKK